MIDIHCHILPNMDDGAAELQHSIEMARQAVSEGVKTIIATPHLNSTYSNKKTDILAATKQLKVELNDANIPINILPGQEPRIYGEILQDYNNGDILTLNHSNYLFIEFPSNYIPQYSKRLLYDIQLEGLTPIIVHPERNKEFMNHPNKLVDFIQNGSLSQITASSVAGVFGKKIQKLSFQLIEANLVHFIASDAHNLESRGFKMVNAFEKIGKRVGADWVNYFHKNAYLVSENKSIYKEVPQPIQQKKFWGIF
ncbi:CpsB/CapC family capsule biosynthesis tyrosine phosphatase [Bacillus spongiae]|uniref:Tyrosine-protein phosphatase n=1 Tax=Bacillus spongiae TaxID=2683610 RepID=A0ABU8HE18_9BACI